MGILLVSAQLSAAAPPQPAQSAMAQASGSGGSVGDCNPSVRGSAFIPVDSWIYPAVLRLYAFGFVENVYAGMRPWTRASVSNMLENTGDMIEDASPGSVTDQARATYQALEDELRSDSIDTCRKGTLRVQSTYSVARAISGTPLRDSFHLGSTIVNDYGRPYENGLNNYTGASGYATAGRYTLYVRGEFQGAPSAAGYSPALYQTLGMIDGTVNPVTGLAYPNQVSIPLGPIATATQGRFLEAYLSAQLRNHVISFGKEDEWLGPAQGGSMAYSNNAENIYAFHINRIEPLYVPGLSWLLGPFRYEFMIGSLRGHTLMPNPLYANDPAAQPNVVSPGDPWVHLEKVSFRPTENLEFGFERTVLFGGEGHSPVTLHTFLKSFFSVANVTSAVKFSSSDPGARFAAFDFSYRLPFVRNWLTLYTDSEAHDDISPIDAPRRAAVRPGLYLSHVPGIPKLDMRVEGANTYTTSSSGTDGRFMYWEAIEKQGYTNQGWLFGDWIGREDTGGQAWLTYHLSGKEWIQGSWRRQKAAKAFIPGGTTLTDYSVQVVKQIRKDLEFDGNFTVEQWKAPIYLPGQHSVTATTIQLMWFPKRKIDF